MYEIIEYVQLKTVIYVFDPTGLDPIDGHYFHVWCPYVQTKQQANTLHRTSSKFTRL